MSLPGSSRARWVVIAVGVGVLFTALVAAIGPYHQTREFRDAVVCHRDTGHCLHGEPGSIVGRRTYVTTHTHTDADGHTHTTTTTHYKITWQRADGSRQTRDVPSDFYDKTREGQPVTLRLWRGEIVAVEVTDAAQWFLPKSGGTLGTWLFVAFLGLGVALWGLLFGWWDGLFMLVYRSFCWMFIAIMPVNITVDVLAFDLNAGGGFIAAAVFGLFAALVAGRMLYHSIVDW